METQVITALEESESQFRDALDARNKQREITVQEIINLANDTIKCGIYGKEMQILIGEKRFDLWFTERGFKCKLDEAKFFIRFSEKRKEVDHLNRQLVLDLGLVEVADREEGSQNKLPQVECRWLNAIMKTQEAINFAQEQAPLNTWPEAHRITLKDSLRPLVELYQKL